MAKILRFPAQHIIDGLKGKLDFYYHDGTACVRTWPRSPGHVRAAAVMAQWEAFSNASRVWDNMSPEIQAAYNHMAGRSRWSGRDLATRSYLTTLYRYPTPWEEEDILVLLDPEIHILDIDFEDTSHPWTELDISAHIPYGAKFALVRCVLQWNAAAEDGSLGLYLRQKGGGQTVPMCGHWCLRTGGIQRNNDVFVGIGTNGKLEYKLGISAGIDDVWVDMFLLGTM